MNLKTKALGLVAGSLLALSLTTGVMAQDAGTSVVLQNGSACTTGTVTATDFTFASATYTGSSYTGAGTATAGSLTVPVTNAVFGVDSCSVSITVSDLSGANVENASVIPGTKVTLTDNGSNTLIGSGSITVPQNDSVTLSASLDMTGVNVEPDTYSGSITVGSAAAS